MYLVPISFGWLLRLAFFFGLYRLQNFNDWWAFRLIFHLHKPAYLSFPCVNPSSECLQTGESCICTWTRTKVHNIACGRDSTSRLDVPCTTEGYHASFGRRTRTGGVLERDSRATLVADERRSRRSEGTLTNALWALAHLETQTTDSSSHKCALLHPISALYPQPFLVGILNRVPMFMIALQPAYSRIARSALLHLAQRPNNRSSFYVQPGIKTTHCRRGRVVSSFWPCFFRGSSPCSGSIKEGKVSLQLLAGINLRVTHTGGGGQDTDAVGGHKKHRLHLGTQHQQQHQQNPHRHQHQQRQQHQQHQHKQRRHQQHQHQ